MITINVHNNYILFWSTIIYFTVEKKIKAQIFFSQKFSAFLLVNRLPSFYHLYLLNISIVCRCNPLLRYFISSSSVSISSLDNSELWFVFISLKYPLDFYSSNAKISLSAHKICILFWNIFRVAMRGCYKSVNFFISPLNFSTFAFFDSLIDFF